MIKILLIILLSTTVFCVNYGTLKVERVISVYDGDTFKADLKNVHPIIGKSVSIRLAGIDTPELRDKRYRVRAMAYNAKYFLGQRLRIGSNIELRNVQRGKYFRIVGDLYIDNVHINKRMIERGYAKRYNGGKKPVW